MKHQKLANFITIIVLFTAIWALYVLYEGPGRAVEPVTSTVDTIGNCCCEGATGVFKVASNKLNEQLMTTDCAIECAERSSKSLGKC